LNLADLKRKLVVGTVQLGLPYGISNSTGKPDIAQAFRILDCASKHGIFILDTAEAYGNALQVIGSYLKKTNNSSFAIISKFIGQETSLHDSVIESIEALSKKNLYAYMYHRYADYDSGRYKKDLIDLKSLKKIERIGISLYSIKELAQVINDPEIDVIQIPFNPLDASVEKKQLLREAKKRGKEIHVRSIFLQGLFFKKSEDLSGNLKPFVPVLHDFNGIISSNKLDIRQACINYCLHQNFIDHVIIGVETEQQLEENINAISESFEESVMSQLESIKINDTSLLNPANWKP
jgi:aryl-alcohol dehydrogenase-like predicted oxidoreductase